MGVVVLLVLLVVFARASGEGSVCLSYHACYDDLFLDWSQLDVYNPQDEERSASTCAITCLRHHPDVQVVMAKLVNVNELLTCGCGSQQALGNRSGMVQDYYSCYVCPDYDSQKCGSEKASSVYNIHHSEGACPRFELQLPQTITTTSTTTTTTTVTTTFTTDPQNTTTMTSTIPRSLSLTFLGCFNEMKVNESHVVTMYLEGEGVALVECSRSCSHVYSTADVLLVKLLNTNKLYCGCGRSETMDLDRAPEGHCDRFCDGGVNEMQCGGWSSVTAYIRSAGGGAPRMSGLWVLLGVLQVLYRTL